MFKNILCVLYKMVIDLRLVLIFKARKCTLIWKQSSSSLELQHKQ